MLLASCGRAREVNGVAASGTACTGCHGDATRAGDAPIQAAPPTSAGGRDPGVHLAHVERGVACTSCHVVPSSPGHSDGVVEVVFSGPAVATGASPRYSPADGTCSGVYCHGATLDAGGKATQPSWTGGTLGCDACHGFPPGRQHSTSTACNTCHPGTVKPDGTIDVAGGLHADGIVESTQGHAPGWADPGKHGDAAKSGLGACRTCHGQNLDGVGGTASSCTSCHAAAGYASWQTNCTFCHGTKTKSYTTAGLSGAAPPRGSRGETTTTARQVGAHQRHLAGGAIGPAIACAECHAVPADLAHLDRSARVTFGAGAARRGATPVWNGTTCQSAYCHGATLKGGSNTTPSWTGGPSQTTCGTCHGVPPPAPHSTSTTCGSCHDGYTSTTVNASLHLNGSVESSGGHAAGWAAKDQHGYAANRQGLSACTRCHGTDYDGGTSGTSCNACHTAKGWAGWQTNCTFCHGTRATTYTGSNLSSAAPPVGTQGETTPSSMAVGAHQKHLSGGAIGPAVTCATCHAVPTSLAHVTGTPVVTMTGAAAVDGVSPSWSATAGTCSTYCHGASLKGGTKTAPTWTGGSSQTTCGACHGIPPPSPHSSSTSCASCHTGYTSSAVNASLHMNGKVDSSGGHAAGWASKDQHGYSVNRSGLTSCKACHGTDLNGGSAQSCTACHARAGFSSWATSCTFCHGSRSSGSSSPPVDTQGGTSTGNVSVGVHANHLGTQLMNAPACTECHPSRTGSNVVTDAAHIDGDGVAEVAFGALARSGGAAPTYTRTSATSASCASTYCHGRFTGGTGATVGWTSTSQVGCSSCHAMPPNSGRHGKHAGEGVGCDRCHSGYTSSSVNRATHINGRKDAVGGGGWNAATCATGCHGNDD
jgi:predicted CxxxxCH...CXXCH cytochrome family protein